MDKLRFWKQKIVQLLHDPPAKPYTGYRDTGRHEAMALRLLETITRAKFKRIYFKRPDWIATGADRPLAWPPSGTKGVTLIQLKWPTQPIVTHPLARNATVDANGNPGVPEQPELEPASEIDVHLPEQAASSQRRQEFTSQQDSTAKDLVDPLPDWNDAELLERTHRRLWRRWREDLMRVSGESRCPDHSVWDHTRMASALAFTDGRDTEANAPRAPWLLRFELGPVGRFIGEARTSRDLWVGSFLLADLIWHAMKPVVELYGPDSIVYPDLRGNPQVDAWLAEFHPDALPEHVRQPGSYAAVLPNAFVALVPYGGGGHLMRIQALAEKAKVDVHQRWADLAAIVEKWLNDQVG